jgi:hypothetical protein
MDVSLQAILEMCVNLQLMRRIHEKNIQKVARENIFGYF